MHVWGNGRTMRIGLNLIGFTPGCGGVETYLLSLLAALQQIDNSNEYLIICEEKTASSLTLYQDNFTLWSIPNQTSGLHGLTRSALHRLSGFDPLRFRLSGLELDLMHHPLTILNPARLPYPSVLTFHDMQQEFFPAFFSTSELRRRRRTYRPSAEQATAIIALSQHTRHCLNERYAITPDKIQVVYSGYSPYFRSRAPEEVAETRRSLGLQRPFMFYPAATWPHKNHLRLLQAIRIMIDRSCFDGELILTGSPMGAQQAVLDAVDRLGLGTAVRWLGHLPHATLPHLYKIGRASCRERV